MKSSGRPSSAEGWTIETYAAHNEALRSEHEKFEAERDRRYTEVKNAEEKALKIKEEADKAALNLASEIQKYKDEKANELRAQINSERGLYPTKSELASAVDKVEALIEPLSKYVSINQGRSTGFASSGYILIQIVVAAGALVGIIELFRRVAP